MNNLVVYLNNGRAGSLKQDDSGLLQFSCDQAWLEKPDAMPLSRSLPRQSQVFPGKKTRPFFAGILPEEGPRLSLAGAQGKLPVIVHQNGICLPLGDTPITHILKSATTSLHATIIRTSGQNACSAFTVRSLAG